MPSKILLLDEPSARRARLIRLLRPLAAEVQACGSPAEAGSILAADTSTGIFLAALARLDSATARFLGGLRTVRPDLSIIVLVPSPEEDLAGRLLSSQTVDGFAPPDAPSAVLSIVRCEIRRLESRERAELYWNTLRRLKVERARSARRAEELESIYEATLENLMTALDLRDVETFGHSQAVAKYSQVLARLMGVHDEALLDDIRRGALLHDVGKIAIPDAILKKPAPLSPEEWGKVRLHPALGHGLIKEIKAVRAVGNIILYHHERYDGTGYPQGLAKDRIPFEARIFALADALDAITAHRPYRGARDFRAARREISRCSGSQFDPAAVKAFLSLKPEEWERIRFETTSQLSALSLYSSLLKNAGK